MTPCCHPPPAPPASSNNIPTPTITGTNSSFLDRKLRKDPVSESFDDRFAHLVAEAGIDLVLADNAELAQSLVRGAAPLCQHEFVISSVCLVQWWQVSIVILECLRSQ